MHAVAEGLNQARRRPAGRLYRGTCSTGDSAERSLDEAAMTFTPSLSEALTAARTGD